MPYAASYVPSLEADIARLTRELDEALEENELLRKDLHGGPALTHAFRLERNYARERLAELEARLAVQQELVSEAYFSGRQSVAWGKRAVEAHVGPLPAAPHEAEGKK